MPLSASAWSSPTVRSSSCATTTRKSSRQLRHTCIFGRTSRSSTAENGWSWTVSALLRSALRLLQERARAAGCALEFDRPVRQLEEVEPADLVVGADGVNSLVRRTHERAFGAQVRLL